MDVDFTIKQGATFLETVRWETTPIVYKAITAISRTAPARITAVGHGVLDGWRVAVVSAKGMTQINAKNKVLRKSDYVNATRIDANTLDLNTVNAASFSAYTSGGYVQYNTPVDLTGFAARMTIRDQVGGTLLLSLTIANNRIAIDTSAKTITLTLSATDTAAITWEEGVYDLEMVSAAGVVTALLSGAVSVIQEVTT